MDVFMKVLAVLVAGVWALGAAAVLVYVGAAVAGRPVLPLGEACRPLTEWVADHLGLVEPFCVDTR
jgi:hypothetical protein